jgi:hypothetical protein
LNTIEPLTAHDTETAVEQMTAEELLRELEGLAPPEGQPDEELDAPLATRVAQ